VAHRMFDPCGTTRMRRIAAAAAPAFQAAMRRLVKLGPCENGRAE
jgi:hypothetical protein